MEKSDLLFFLLNQTRKKNHIIFPSFNFYSLIFHLSQITKGFIYSFHNVWNASRASETFMDYSIILATKKLEPYKTRPCVGAKKILVPEPFTIHQAVWVRVSSHSHGVSFCSENRCNKKQQCRTPRKRSVKSMVWFLRTTSPANALATQPSSNSKSIPHSTPLPSTPSHALHTP